MSDALKAGLHDAYAADYDSQVQAYGAYVADVLFGLCYEYTRPGQDLLDLGVGSGLLARLFTKAGLRVCGMDFSRAMLEICREKQAAAELALHDMTQAPWPYPAGRFDMLGCCGVLHFIGDLETVFGEARRVLRGGGCFGFSTKTVSGQDGGAERYERQTAGEFEIFSHLTGYVERVLEANGFVRLKTQKCFVGEDVFTIWVTQKLETGRGADEP